MEEKGEPTTFSFPLASSFLGKSGDWQGKAAAAVRPEKVQKCRENWKIGTRNFLSA